MTVITYLEKLTFVEVTVYMEKRDGTRVELGSFNVERSLWQSVKSHENIDKPDLIFESLL